MKKLLYALLIGLTLALSVTPVFAQGSGNDNSDNLCIGGNSTYDPGSRAHDYSLMGCNGTVKSGATVPGDVAVFGGNLTVESGATVNGNVALFGGSTQIAGQVDGDVAIMGGAVSMASTAVVNGSVHVLGGAYTAAEGARVKGGVSRANGPSFNPRQPIPAVTTIVRPKADFDLFGGIIRALAFAALGMLLVVIFPEPTRRVIQTAQAQPGPSVGVGCLTLIVVPILGVLVAVTLIGIPVTLVLGLALVAAVAFGSIAIGYYAGQRILTALKVRDFAPVVAVFVGVMALGVVGVIPCVGWLVSLIAAVLGLGAVVLTRFGTRNYPLAPAPASGPFPPMPPAPGQWYSAQPQSPVPPYPAQPPMPPTPPYPGQPPTPPTPPAPGGPSNPQER